MNRYLKVLAFTLLGGVPLNALAETVAAPKGWTASMEGPTRVITKGTSRIEIGPWVDLGGRTPDAWLQTLADRAPSAARLISVGKVKPERVKGAFAVTRKVAFSGGNGSSILYVCPGGSGLARLMQLDVENRNFGDLFVGAIFGEKVCQQETPQDVATLAEPAPAPKIKQAAPRGDNQTLAQKNAEIPLGSRPVGAYVRLDQSWVGFPATLIFDAKLDLIFSNGYTTSCANWDPTTLEPTPQSVGRNIEGCKVTRGKSEGKNATGFAPGETINIEFGRVSGFSNDWALSTGVSLSGGDLVMTKDGKIAVGSFQVSQISSGGNGVNSTKRKNLRGRYYLNGFTITIETDGGEILHGFFGVSSDKGSAKVDHVFLNGTHYWDRKKR